MAQTTALLDILGLSSGHRYAWDTGTDTPHRGTSYGVNLRPSESSGLLQSQKGEVGDSTERVNKGLERQEGVLAGRILGGNYFLPFSTTLYNIPSSFLTRLLMHSSVLVMTPLKPFIRVALYQEATQATVVFGQCSPSSPSRSLYYRTRVTAMRP